MYILVKENCFSALVGHSMWERDDLSDPDHITQILTYRDLLFSNIEFNMHETVWETALLYHTGP